MRRTAVNAELRQQEAAIAADSTPLVDQPVALENAVHDRRVEQWRVDGVVLGTDLGQVNKSTKRLRPQIAMHVPFVVPSMTFGLVHAADQLRQMSQPKRGKS